MKLTRMTVDEARRQKKRDAWAGMSLERREAEKLRRREYYQAHRGEMNAAARKWQEENRERMRGYANAYMKERRKVDPQYERSSYYQMKLSSGVRCVANGYFPQVRKPFVGCTWAELKEHFEGLFEVGMTWDNYGKEWQVDHIVPRTKYDLTDYDEVLRCFNYRNLRPRWNRDNNRRRSDESDVVRDAVKEPVPEPTIAAVLEMQMPGPNRTLRKMEYLRELREKQRKEGVV